MDYNFLTLNTSDFEHLVQSLTQKALGINSLVFGNGPDGGRELTYEGSAPYPNIKQNWNGYWIVQAKYKEKNISNSDDFKWFKNQFEKEMEKFKDRKRNLRIPQNYLFFTNINLTSVSNSGTKDKVQEIIKEYEKLIPNIYIGSYDELCRLLDNNRDVAISYSSFILSGDILSKLYKMLDYSTSERNNIKKLFLRYLEASFNGELYSKLIQAGDVTNHVNIEKVFIDIAVSNKSQKEINFLENLIEIGNRKNLPQSKKMVLVGGAGSGKSTLSQLASQIYTAFFVLDNKQSKVSDKILEFSKEFDIISKPKCIRFPFKIILKDFAAWIIEQKEKNESQTIINYIKHRIEIIGDGKIATEDIRDFLTNISTIFIFDGLDEVPITSNRDEVLNEINNFIDIDLLTQNSDSIILCTTRQQGYTKEFDNNIYNHYYVMELSNDNCTRYLNKLLNNIEPSFDERVNYLKTLEEALRDEVTGRLMRTPLQATIMTILVKSGGKPSRNKYNLFKEYYDTIYKRELQKGVIPILKDYKRNIDDIHALLGFELQAKSEGINNPSSLFHLDEFRNLIKKYLVNKEEWIEKDAEIFIAKIIDAVTNRLVFIGEIEDDKVGFVIRSLQEYFAANYLISFNDNEVIKNIKDISESAYWLNTLLFAVSGIHNNKNHLIDKILLECQRLNGNEDNCFNETLYSTLNLGSILSLEILAEGIFSDSPKNKNRFIRLIESLVSNINTLDYYKIRILSSDLVTNWIINTYLKKELSSKKNYIQKYSAYKIAFILIGNHQYVEPISNLLKANWDENDNYQLMLLMDIMDVQHTSFFQEKVHHSLHLDTYFNYSFLFPKGDIDGEYDYLNNIISRYNDDTIFNSRLIEIIFLNSLSNHISTDNNEDNLFLLLNRITGLTLDFTENNGTWGILGYDKKTAEISIVNGYSVEIDLINSIDYNLSVFKKIFEKYNLIYLQKYIQFIFSPSKKNLIELILSLKENNNSEVYSHLIASSRIWVFRDIAKVYQNFSDIDSLISAIQNDDFGDYDDWLTIEREMLRKTNFDLIFKHASIRSMSTGGFKILFDFFNLLHNEISQNQHHVNFEVSKIINWSHDEKRTNKSLINKDILPKEINSIFPNIINEIEIEDNYIWHKITIIKAILIYIYCNEVEKINEINNNAYKYFDYENYKHGLYLRTEIITDVLKKAVDYYNATKTLKKESKIDKLILLLLLKSNENLHPIIINLNHDSITINEKTSPNELFFKLICYQPNSEEIEIIHSLIKSYGSNFILIFTRIFLNLKINKSWCHNTFIFLHNCEIIKQDSNIETISLIQQYLKFLSESKFTSICRLQQS